MVVTAVGIEPGPPTYKPCLLSIILPWLTFIIKPADKGSAKVIQDKHNYVKEGERQLHNDYFYDETETDLTGKVIHSEPTCKQYVTEGTDFSKH